MQIKEYKKLSHILLRDGRTLVSETTPQEIGEYLSKNSHILIEGELHSKYDIVSVVPASLDDLEWFILSQSKEMQEELRRKKRRLLDELGKGMSLEYAQNFVQSKTLNS